MGLEGKHMFGAIGEQRVTFVVRFMNIFTN